MRTFLNYLEKLVTPKICVYIGLLVYTFIFYKITVQRGIYLGVVFSASPLIIITLFLLFKNPFRFFVCLFIVNYLIMGTMRYFNFPAGILMDALSGICFISIIVKTTYEKINWERIYNPLTLITSIWLLFCIAELLNSNAVPITGWATKVRGMAIYPIIMVIFSSVILKKYEHLKFIVILWSILTLLAAFKGYWQKNHGFDSSELYWLFVGGGGRTHLINTGIRFFSFFTDAGNFGANMGFSMVVFSILAFYLKNKWLKIYFIIVALSGAYGMIISGTRGSLAVPFAGYALCILLSKNWKISISTLVIVISAFFFLNFTNIGNNNKYISRMRSAFDKNDPSLNVRLENQKKLKEYMKDIPFGTSIGFYGYQVDKNHPFYKISKIPSDSWYVQIWIQTGIIGLTLHIFLLVSSILIGAYIILFKIKNKELRGILTAMLSGVFGLLGACYGNELLGQFPNSFMFYIFLSFIFLGKYYDKELEEYEQLT